MKITVVTLKEEIELSKNSHRLARKMKDIIYDMDSLDYQTRYKAHLDFNYLIKTMGEENLNKVLDEFTTWKKQGSKITRDKYLRTYGTELFLFIEKECFLVTPDTVFKSMVTMPKTKWIVNCLEHL